MNKLERKRLYAVWVAMWNRCANPSNNSFQWYGGRGISVCEQWAAFRCFLRDMGPRPPHQWLERINNDGNYSPDNCKWATEREQKRNKRDTVRVLYQGEITPLITVAEKANIPYPRLKMRLAAGLDLGTALSVPCSPRGTRYRMDSGDGSFISLRKFCLVRGLSYGAIQKRLQSGWDLQEALQSPIGRAKKEKASES